MEEGRCTDMIEDVGTWDTWDINTLTKSCAAFTSGRSVNPGQGAFLGEETLPFSCCLSGTGVYGISTPENIGENNNNNRLRLRQDESGTGGGGGATMVIPPHVDYDVGGSEIIHWDLHLGKCQHFETEGTTFVTEDDCNPDTSDAWSNWEQIPIMTIRRSCSRSGGVTCKDRVPRVLDSNNVAVQDCFCRRYSVEWESITPEQASMALQRDEENLISLNVNGKYLKFYGKRDAGVSFLTTYVVKLRPRTAGDRSEISLSNNRGVKTVQFGNLIGAWCVERKKNFFFLNYMIFILFFQLSCRSLVFSSVKIFDEYCILWFSFFCFFSVSFLFLPGRRQRLSRLKIRRHPLPSLI